jgi:predicted ArsR family transcriptional regulator
MSSQSEQETSLPITNHMEVEGELCKLLYQKFGHEALPIVSSVFRRWGAYLGEKRREKLGGKVDFKAAVEAQMKPAMEREPKPEIIEFSDERVEIRIHLCPYRLKGNIAPLCEAMEEMDRAILQSICKDNIETEIIESLANDDECCHAILKKA